MALIYQGRATAIAEQLSLSAKTVDKHRENLMRKLEVNNVGTTHSPRAGTQADLNRAIEVQTTEFTERARSHQKQNVRLNM